MSIFKINLDVEDLIDGLKEKTEQNINYIKENFSKIIESEEESLEGYVNSSSDAISMLLTIRDNQGELIINNDDGEEIGVCGYYTDIII